MNDSPTDRTAAVLDVRDLTKRFGKYTAVDGLSFSIAPGEALALWGSNGAGKTTAIRCILGITASKGDVSIEGIDVARDAKRARCHIGYVPQENSFQGDLGVGEAMRFYARLKGQTTQRAADLLEHVGLTEHAKKKISALSGGMRKRLALAAALLNDPPLLVLDEIAANLDAEGRNSFLALLCELKHQGKAILFTSHRLDEVTALADRVLVLRQGKAIGVHSPSGLSAAIGIESRVKVLLPEASIRHALEALHAEGFAAQRNGRGIWVDVMPGNKAAPIHALASRQIVIDDFEIENHDAENSHVSRH